MKVRIKKMPDITAVIADDEEALRFHLKKLLGEVWPELSIVGEAANGQAALELIRRHEPTLVFLDIRMPGMSGMAVAKQIVETAHVVFITAYNAYAVEAFEKGAVDYLLKPVTRERLAKTVRRIRKRVTEQKNAVAVSRALEKIACEMNTREPKPRLKWIRAQHTDGIRLIPVESIYYFKAEDKYTRVVSDQGESLIREPIRTLLEQLDENQFWRIHRGTIVNAGFIEKVGKSITGSYQVKLKDLGEILTVSRTYAHLFKQM
jgi:DNA-binding LytR/AlgR family response regulator